MARPKTPLISKRAALQAALTIIENEGIDNLSIRRLAEELNVNGASLYHHFKNKDEIIVGAAKLALEEVRAPQGHEEPWRVWLLRNARRLRDAYVAHPDLLTVMLRREPLGIGVSQLDATVERLEAEGVPLSAIVPMLEGLELWAGGNALHQSGDARHPAPHVEGRATHLDRAVAAREVAPERIFEIVSEQIVAATLSAAQGGPGDAGQPSGSRSRPRRRISA